MANEDLEKQFCDWENEPPANTWDLHRRSILLYIAIAERNLAALHNAMGEHGIDNAPVFGKLLTLIDIAAAAKRAAIDTEDSLRLRIPGMYKP